MRVKYNNTENKAFFSLLKKRIDTHFKEKHTTQFANNAMWFKIGLIMTTWLVSYLLIILGYVQGFWIIPMAFVHCFTHLSIAFNIAHDANHNAISSSSRVNRLLSYTLDLIGVNSYLWRISHNQEHHTYINVLEIDNNIQGFGVLRFSPQDQKKNFFKYQHIYATLLYGLATFNYVTVKDFKLMREAFKDGIKVPAIELVKFVVFKAFYYTYMLILPTVVLGISFGYVFLFFFLVHFFLGIGLSYVFLCGHVTEGAHYPEIVDGKIADSWAVHVVKTTCDYASNNKILTWFVGGINIHVIHHLLPAICHIHYAELAPILKQTAKDCNLDYREHPTFVAAISSHIKTLKEVGMVAH